MHITEAFKGKTLVITGGTGSFGSTVLKHFLTTDIGEIRIISRDEWTVGPDPFEDEMKVTIEKAIEGLKAE